jgi:hypothetical protein
MRVTNGTITSAYRAKSLKELRLAAIPTLKPDELNTFHSVTQAMTNK